MALTLKPLKPLSLSSGFVLSEFASEFGPGASAHRFTKTQGENRLAMWYFPCLRCGLVPNVQLQNLRVVLDGVRC